MRSLLLILLAFVGPASVLAQTDESTPFDSFVALFPPLELPFRLFEETRQAEQDLTAVPDDHLPHLPDATAFYGRHFAVGKLAATDRFIALLYKMEGGAGGYNDQYYLLTYSPDGGLIAEQRVADFSGDLSFESSTDMEITPELEVRGVDVRVERGEAGRDAISVHRDRAGRDRNAVKSI